MTPIINNDGRGGTMKRVEFVDTISRENTHVTIYKNDKVNEWLADNPSVRIVQIFESMEYDNECTIIYYFKE